MIMDDLEIMAILNKHDVGVGLGVGELNPRKNLTILLFFYGSFPNYNTLFSSLQELCESWDTDVRVSCPSVRYGKILSN